MNAEKPTALEILRDKQFDVTMKNYVLVAEYRRAYDHLLDQVNSHYHDCVNARELNRWTLIVKDLIKKVENMDCKRANEMDREWHRKSIKAAYLQLEKAKTRTFNL